MNADATPLRPGAGERAIVLMYHRVGEIADASERPYAVSPALFAEQMRALAGSGLRACGIDDFTSWIRGEAALPSRSFLLTFDDGFMGVCDHALPVLRELGWPLTVFVVSGLIGKRDEWMAREGHPGKTYPLLGRSELDAMIRSGASIESHSRRHPDLRTLADADLAQELAGSRSDLEDLLGRRVRYLAYPYGRYDERVLAATKAAGYEAAFCVESGFNRPGIDPFRIRRLDVYGTDTPARLLRKLALGTNDGTLAASLRYYVSRLTA